VTAALLAPAKVNLFLHVGRPGADGYHPLASLMVFADLGDQLAYAPAETATLTVEGPFAGGLSAGEDNLVMRAARALLARAGRDDLGYHLILDKRLPLSAGLGGGSSDAGAAIRLLNTALGLDLPNEVLLAVAAELGADGAACFHARPVVATGRGDQLAAPPSWPALPCVLLNPAAPSPTAAVYRAFDQAGSFGAVDPPPLPDAETPVQVAQILSALRNDLEGPAAGLEPRIGEAVAVLKGQPETLLARMSGSGATCFALCRDKAAAQALAARLFDSHPAWWARPCILKGAGG